MLKNLKIKKKFWNIFFCLQFSCTFCEVIAEHFKKRAKCFKKMPNWRQKRQNGGRQLKVCCHYKIIKLLALINALDSYSKSKFDPKWLHLALNVSSKHSVPKKMRYCWLGGKINCIFTELDKTWKKNKTRVIHSKRKQF